MIVELLGPQAAGKTTLARALATRLLARGLNVYLRLSYRPGEQSSGAEHVGGHRQISRGFRRLIRPAAELICYGQSAGSGTATALASILMNGEASHWERWCRYLTWLRLRQYLARLSAAWLFASDCCDVAIFDQAFGQALLSLLSLNPALSDEDIRTILSSVPIADLVIRIEVPPEQIERRIAQRMQSLGTVGRLLEARIGPTCEQILASARLNAIFAEQGRAMIPLDAADELPFEAAVNEAEREVLNRFRILSLDSRIIPRDGPQCSGNLVLP